MSYLKTGVTMMFIAVAIITLQMLGLADFLSGTLKFLSMEVWTPNTFSLVQALIISTYLIDYYQAVIILIVTSFIMNIHNGDTVKHMVNNAF